MKHKKLFVTTIILDVLAFIGLFILYGPFSYVRVTVITTAMHSKSHRYLARTFYSDKMINKVLSENYMAEIQKNGIIERKNGKRDREWIITKQSQD